MKKVKKVRKPCFFTPDEIKKIEDWAKENAEGEFSPAVRKLVREGFKSLGE